MIVESKSQPVELDNSTIELHLPSRQKNSLQSYCSVDFDFLALARLDMTFDVMLRDDSSFSKLTNLCNFKNVSFSLLLVKANFLKKFLWKSIYLWVPGSLKPSSSICYVLFSSEEKYFGVLLVFHKSPLELN